MRNLAALPLALLVCANATAAQQRTPENAHAFLREIMRSASTHGASTQSVIYEIRSSGCSTMTIAPYHERYVRDSFSLDWTTVSNIAQDGAIIKISGQTRHAGLYSSGSEKYSSMRNEFGLTFPSVDLATRAKAAFTVIWQSCDRTRGYGF